MNIFGKSVIDTCSLIEETSSVENAYVDSIYDQELMDTFINTFACLDELEEDVCTYIPEVAPVFESQGTYYIELEQVAKVADYNEVTIAEAFIAIAEANNLDIDNMAMVVESDDIIGMIVAEAKCAKGSKAEKSKMKGLAKTKEVIDDTVDEIKEKTGKALKVVKKPCKGGKKKCKK